MIRLALAALWAVLTGCIDFGYDVRPPDELLDAAPAPDDGATDAAGGDGASACVEGPTAPSDTGPQVAIVTLAVDQPVLAIAVGETVTWTNTDSMPHTVTAGAPGAELPVDQGGFDSGDMATGARFAYRFCAPRNVSYFCRTHAAQMNGYRVVVQE